MNRWQPKDPIKHAARKSGAQRRVGRNAKCKCGESRPEALIRGTKPIRCAECQRKRDRSPTTDEHHVAGERNSPVTVTVPVNDHRAELSVMQMDWSRTLRENPRGDPLIAVGAGIRGAADTILYLIKKCIDVAVALLEVLAEFLRQRLGDRWWQGTPIEAFAPKT
jgi:hypothetical protein